ncbi:hypothetical protein A2W24_04800 [Microgenomates group bacterium RBG_16_45_19]|nr:MAG: hypothetical protein A2W24_04800 [Microgenomates group bacterium RBG_16_45_19]
MFHKLVITGGWLLGCSLTIIICFTTLTFLHRTQVLSYGLNPTLNPSVPALVLLAPPAIKGMTSRILAEDARPVLIAEFLAKHQSPLTPYDYWGEYLTKLADQYRMDYRLLPAIAMQESNLCKKIPAGSYNCLGLGIHAQGTWEFPSFEANFEQAAKVLRRHYLDEGLITPELIQDKYTPRSNGSWEFAVNTFMDKLETADW